MQFKAEITELIVDMVAMIFAEAIRRSTVLCPTLSSALWLDVGHSSLRTTHASKSKC